ncbi:DUF5685 family protein [Natroniella sp. ANB-PHB2]|uniref:DUF5685 family protein n=1 Tax=Natroniella sp. ANB-PHB2 TaxID=3384444 RepID=UPI0038D3FA03
MLGYFRPKKCLLSKEDREFYKAMYCSFCHSIKKNHGLTTTLFLQYDLIFLLLIIDSELDLFSHGRVRDKRCLFPLKKVSCVSENSLLDKLSDLAIFVVYTYYLDKKIDGDDYRVKDKLIHKLIKIKGNKSFKGLKNIKGIKEKLVAGMKLEEQREYSPDYRISFICDLYANLVVDNLGLVDLEVDYYKVAYNMCKVMYYLDALEDFKSDRKNGEVNILFDLNTDLDQIVGYVRNKLISALAEIKGSLLFNKNKKIIENIIEIHLQGVFNKFRKELLMEN